MNKYISAIICQIAEKRSTKLCKNPINIKNNIISLILRLTCCRISVKIVKEYAFGITAAFLGYAPGLSAKTIYPRKKMIFDLQKANMLKRISAFLFDFIMRMMLIAGLAIIISAILGYDGKLEKLESCYDKYEEKYGINLDISDADFTALSDGEKAKYEEAEKEFSADGEAMALTALILNLTILIAVFSILFGYLILEFLVPLLMGNGQTLGKKIFGIGVMREDGVRITHFMLFVRAILGKCTLEALVPIAIAALILIANAGLFGILALLMLAALEVFLMVKTKTNSCIHDVLSYAVTVDMASQMIFDSEAALVEYKNKIHAEAVDRADY